MATKAARELGEGHRIYVWVRRVRRQDSQACTRNGQVEVGKGAVAEARGHCTQEVAQARPDAEADEQVALIRCIAVRGGRVRAKEETVKDGDKSQGTRGRLSN